VIAEKSTKNNYIHHNVNTLANGMYLMQVIKQGQVTATGKFLVQH
jgi:hypothetical protein